MEKQFELSIIIPARQEMFLAKTIENILENTSEQTEIIAVLDGKWSDPPIKQHERVNVIYVPEAIGQRAAQNLGVRLSKAKYVAKIDAHCSVDKDFDIKMLEAFKKTGDEVTMVAIMRNLWAFDWVCYHNFCGWKGYQGPTPEKCPKCGRSNKIRRRMQWIGKHNPQSVSYCFDSEPHFQYFEAYKHREPFITDKREKGFTETMSLQGSFFMCTRERYWKLKLCDENFGSWGSQGLELACKTWLSGGRVLVNHSTWYAHMFRTSGGDFGFPYHQSGREVAKCKAKVRDMFWKNKYDKQIYPLSWLIEKFWPIPGWSEQNLSDLKLIGSKFVNPPISVSSPNSITKLTESSSTSVSLSGK